MFAFKNLLVRVGNNNGFRGIGFRDIINRKYKLYLKLTDESTLTLPETALKLLFNSVIVPFGFKSVPTNHIALYFTFGKYDGYRKSGLKWIPPLSDKCLIYCGDRTLSQTNLHLTDSSSNPIYVNTFVIYDIKDPLNYIVNLDNLDGTVNNDDNANKVLSNWIENIIRHNISNYSYTELTSQTNKEQLEKSIVNAINSDSKSIKYGVYIQRFGLLQINYAPEIAETMLIKQKALATIEARKELVDASLNLITDISLKLNDKLSQEDKSKLITCLTVSMIGNNSPSNVINLN